MLLKCGNVSGGICIRQQKNVKEQLRESFPYKRPLREESLLEQIRSGKLFGYVQCEIEVPEELKEKFAKFLPIFKNANVGRHDIGSLMQDYPAKQGLLCQPRKMLISSFFLENGTLNTHLLLFYSDLGLVCKKIYRFVEDLQLNVSINLCNLLSMLVEKETRIQTLVLSQKQWNCLPTAPTAIKLWIVAATLSRNIWAMRKHMGLSTRKFSSVWITSMINCMKYKWQRQRLSTENQSMLGFSYSNRLNLECWSLTTIFSRDSVTSTNLRS